MGEVATFTDIHLKERLFLGTRGVVSAQDGDLFLCGTIRSGVVECGALKAEVLRDVGSLRVTQGLFVGGEAVAASMRTASLCAREIRLECLGGGANVRIAARHPRELLLDGNVSVGGSLSAGHINMNVIDTHSVSFTQADVTLRAVPGRRALALEGDAEICGTLTCRGALRADRLLGGTLGSGPAASQQEAVDSVRAMYASTNLGLDGYYGALPPAVCANQLVDQGAVIRAATAAAGHALQRLDGVQTDVRCLDRGVADLASAAAGATADLRALWGNVGLLEERVLRGETAASGTASEATRRLHALEANVGLLHSALGDHGATVAAVQTRLASDVEGLTKHIHERHADACGAAGTLEKRLEATREDLAALHPRLSSLEGVLEGKASQTQVLGLERAVQAVGQSLSAQAEAAKGQADATAQRLEGAEGKLDALERLVDNQMDTLVEHLGAIEECEAKLEALAWKVDQESSAAAHAEHARLLQEQGDRLASVHADLQHVRQARDSLDRQVRVLGQALGEHADGTASRVQCVLDRVAGHDDQLAALADRVNRAAAQSTHGLRDLTQTMERSAASLRAQVDLANEAAGVASVRAAAGEAALRRLDALDGAIGTTSLRARDIDCATLTCSGGARWHGDVGVSRDLDVGGNADVRGDLAVAGAATCSRLLMPVDPGQFAPGEVERAVQVVRAAYARNGVSLRGYTQEAVAWGGAPPAPNGLADEGAMARAAVAAAGDALRRIDDLTSGAWEVPQVHVGSRGDIVKQAREGWGVWCDTASGKLVCGGQRRVLSKAAGVELRTSPPGAAPEPIEGGSGFFAGKVLASEFVAFSDSRLKRGVERVDPGECMRLLDGVHTHVYEQGDEVKYGFIAQQLGARIPQAVRTCPGVIDGALVPDVASVDSMQVVALLVGAVRHLAARLEALAPHLRG